MGEVDKGGEFAREDFAEPMAMENELNLRPILGTSNVGVEISIDLSTPVSVLLALALTVACCRVAVSGWAGLSLCGCIF